MKEENSIPNIWKAQEKVIHFYRRQSFALAGVAAILLIFIMAILFRDPIVVVKDDVTQEFYPSERQLAPIEKIDVEGFSKRFLAALYVWSGFNGEKLAKEITPFAESGLVSKVVTSVGITSGISSILRTLSNRHTTRSSKTSTLTKVMA